MSKFNYLQIYRNWFIIYVQNQFSLSFTINLKILIGFKNILNLILSLHLFFCYYTLCDIQLFIGDYGIVDYDLKLKDLCAVLIFMWANKTQFVIANILGKLRKNEKGKFCQEINYL